MVRCGRGFPSERNTSWLPSGGVGTIFGTSEMPAPVRTRAKMVSLCVLRPLWGSTWKVSEFDLQIRPVYFPGNHTMAPRLICSGARNPNRTAR